MGQGSFRAQQRHGSRAGSQRGRRYPPPARLHSSGVLRRQAVPAAAEGMGDRIQHRSGLVVPVNPAEFERLVAEALDSLPERFADLLDNVVVVVEEEPSASDLDVMEDEHGELLGLYRGTPMTRRTHDSFRLPDQIAIFRGPILRVTRGAR